MWSQDDIDEWMCSDYRQRVAMLRWRLYFVKLDAMYHRWQNTMTDEEMCW